MKPWCFNGEKMYSLKDLQSMKTTDLKKVTAQKTEQMEIKDQILMDGRGGEKKNIGKIRSFM